MRPLHGFIVSPSEGKLYKNTRKTDGKDFVISSSMENAKIVNREAIVQAAPATYIGSIEEGATVIVHHNVFRKTYASGGGEETFSSDRVDENNYFIPIESIYAFKNTGDELWTAMEYWCFVRPSNDLLHGELVIGNEYLKQNEVFERDEVVFVPDSEYEFYIDGEVLYRIDSRDICLARKAQKN